MFGLMRTFPVLEEEPPSAPDGTYPDDANQRAYGDSVKTTICRWVQVVVDLRASEAKRDEAFALLVFTQVLLGSTGAMLLWPFLLGTLLRRADARELSKEPGHSSDEKDENEDVRGEVKLVQLLRMGGLVRHPYASWLPRLLAVLESGKTPDVLKVALIEHLAINRVTPNSTKIVTSLLEGVVKRATTSDKVRACAVFAVGYLLHRNTAGNERLRTTWADFFYKPTADEPAAVRFGLLAQTAMAWVAVHHLGEQAPDAAINRAVDALVHDLEFLSAWRVIEGGDALLQPRGLAHVPVAKLLDLDKASLSDLNEKLRHGINISSRASLETASVMWPSLESFDEFFTGPLIKLRFGRAKPHLVSSLLDQLGTSSSDRAIQRLASCLIAVTLPSAFAEGTVRQEVERDDPDALGVLRRLADEPQFGHLWHWIGRQADAKAKKGRQPVLARMDHDFGSKVQGLPLTSRADLQRFLDAPLPAHWSTGKWMPDLTGLDDEDWTIGQQQTIQDRCATIIRGLASRSEEVQRFRSMCLWTLWRVEHDARLAIKWVVKLVGCKRVIDAARLVDRLLIPCAVATAQLAPITFDVAGFDRKCLPPTGGLHDDVGQYMQDYLELLRDGDQPESVRTQILNLLAMFPEHWPVTLPHVATLWNTAAESLSLRAAALSTISFIVPATPDLWQACSHEDREQARRAIAELTSFLPPLPGVVSLRDVAASALASSPVGKLSGNDWEGLPEELRGLMERKAWACTKNNEFYRNLQMSAALGVCRLLLRARGIVGDDATISGNQQQATPIEWSGKVSEVELELTAWLPSIKSVLCTGEGHARANLGHTYLHLLFGSNTSD